MDGLLENTVLLHLVDYRRMVEELTLLRLRRSAPMAYYTTCPHCGANLDPGERCDCQDRQEEPASEPIKS